MKKAKVKRKKKTKAQIWGSQGGKARTRSLSPAKRRALARKAVKARWRRSAAARLEKRLAEVVHLREQVREDRKGRK
jgi:hypothetical protein